MLSRLVVDASFWALIAWISFVAIEPLVRRRWPRMLIGWSRLLDGRATDPIIGRDLLIGMAAGMSIVIAWQLSALVPGASLLQMTTTPLSGTRHVVYYILFGVLEATMRALGLATLLLALHALIKDRRVALAVSIAVLALSFVDDPTGPIPVRVAYALLAAAIVVVIVFRYGLVAVATCAYTILLLRNLPITTDPTAWYFGRSALAVPSRPPGRDGRAPEPLGRQNALMSRPLAVAAGTAIGHSPASRRLSPRSSGRRGTTQPATLSSGSSCSCTFSASTADLIVAEGIARLTA